MVTRIAKSSRAVQLNQLIKIQAKYSDYFQLFIHFLQRFHFISLFTEMSLMYNKTATTPGLQIFHCLANILDGDYVNIAGFLSYQITFPVIHQIKYVCFLTKVVKEKCVRIS